MTKLSRDRAAQDSKDRHDLRMAALRLQIRNAGDIQSARTALIEAVLSLPGVSADPVTVPDVTVLVDTFMGSCPAIVEAVRAVLPEPVRAVLSPTVRAVRPESGG
jgi:hypothetical protein